MFSPISVVLNQGGASRNFQRVASPYAPYNIVWSMNLLLNTFVFTAYLKSGRLAENYNYLREARWKG